MLAKAWQASVSAMQNDPLLVYRLGQLLVDDGLISTARADNPLGVHRLPDVE